MQKVEILILLLVQLTHNQLRQKTITWVRAYLVKRSLILEPQKEENKSNEITAIGEFIKTLAEKRVVFAFYLMITQKKIISAIVDKGRLDLILLIYFPQN